MRILILGGNGMLSHQLCKHLTPRHDVRVTLRLPLSVYQKFGLYHAENAYPEVDIRSMDRLKEVLTEFQPQVVVNGIGITKQRKASTESIPSIEINALFPHKLVIACKSIDARLIHMSTDCVFSGNKGKYNESDMPDANDLYGRTKLLGEVHAPQCVTLRTSIIGTELIEKKNLLEWFLLQPEEIFGYKRAIFSGFTTIEMSRIIEKIILDHPRAEGLYHVSSSPISKFDLLTLIKHKLKLKVNILSDDTFRCDRSLDSTLFRNEFLYAPPDWNTMIEELALNLLRRNHAI